MYAILFPLANPSASERSLYPRIISEIFHKLLETAESESGRRIQE